MFLDLVNYSSFLSFTLDRQVRMNEASRVVRWKFKSLVWKKNAIYSSELLPVSVLKGFRAYVFFRMCGRVGVGG